MRYNKIRKMDISDGPGVRVSIFVQGCTFNCKGCFNKDTHDFEGGNEFTEKELNDLMGYAKPNYIQGLSILGGEPMHTKNVATVSKIIKKFKAIYPSKTIWVWTGFEIENLLNSPDINIKNILDNIDVLVDGRFELERINTTLRFCGSDNQRVIDVPASFNAQKIILYKDR